MSTLITLPTTTSPHGQSVVEGHGVFGGDKNSMLTSTEVVKTIRVELSHIDDQIRNHVFLRDLREGKVHINALRAFSGHTYHISNSVVRSGAMMVHRFSNPLVQAFFKQVLQGEFEDPENIVVLAKKLGMTMEELNEYPLMPEGFAYATYMGWLSTYASAAEIVAGVLVNFAVWGHNCGHMSQSLKDHYGFTPEDTEFLDAFANRPSFEPVALQIIQDGLKEGVAPVQIRRAAFLFQGYEKMFWDAMAKAANV